MILQDAIVGAGACSGYFKNVIFVTWLVLIPASFSSNQPGENIYSLGVWSSPNNSSFSTFFCSSKYFSSTSDFVASFSIFSNSSFSSVFSSSNFSVNSSSTKVWETVAFSSL